MQAELALHEAAARFKQALAAVADTGAADELRRITLEDDHEQLATFMASDGQKTSQLEQAGDAFERARTAFSFAAPPTSSTRTLTEVGGDTLGRPSSATDIRAG